MLNVTKGALAGALLSFLLAKNPKNPIRLIGLGSGFGAGVATNQVADEFNRIERREGRVEQYLSGIGEGGEEREVVNQAYLSSFSQRLNLYRFNAFQK